MIVDVVWITTVGTSHSAVINTLWSFVRETGALPRLVVLLKQTSKAIEREYDIVKEWLTATARVYPPEGEFKIIDASYNEESIPVFIWQLSTVLDAYATGVEKEVHLDLTPGRKFMSMIIGMVGLARGDAVKGLYYNHLLDNRYLNRPHPLVPAPLSRVYNLMDLQSEFKSLAGISGFEMAIVEQVAASRGSTYQTLRRDLTRKGLNDDFVDKSLETSLRALVSRHVLSAERSESRNGGELVYTLGPMGSTYVPSKVPSFDASNSPFRHSTLPLKGPMHRLPSYYPYLDLYKCPTISRDEILILLNNIYIPGSKFRVEIAPTGYKLCSFTLNRQITLEMNKYTYNRPEDLPDWLDTGFETNWFDLLKMSGIVAPTNYDDLIELITTRSMGDPAHGSRATYVTMDTNVHFNRLGTRLVRDLVKSHRRRAPIVRFLLPEPVRNELSRFHRRYPSDIKNFDASLYNAIGRSHVDVAEKLYPNIFRSFYNQSVMNERKRKIAFFDFLDVMRYGESIPAARTSTNDNDQKIIFSLSEYIERNNCDIIFITEDRDCYEQTSGHSGLTAFLVKYPILSEVRHKSTFSIDWEQLVDLLYCASIWHGAVTIVSGDEPLFTLQGIWSGRTPDVESRLVRVRLSNEFLDVISRDLELLRADRLNAENYT